MNDRINAIQSEVKKVVSGKDVVIERILNAILAGGHILLEDVPGVGKTTIALAMSKAMGLSFNRVQFTPDVVPSDITGFTVFNRDTEKFTYREGAIMANFFLADEINRTSSKTQSALLEVMQEGKVTVDGEAHQVPQPFVVMATQNPVGMAGTQLLPEAQLDRFMIKVSLGYPDSDSQLEIFKRREDHDPINDITNVVSKEDLIEMRSEAGAIYVDDKIYRYITDLCEASRNNKYIKLGVSPRGALAIAQMSKAHAYMSDRDYAVPEDVDAVFCDTSRHRIVLNSKVGFADANDGALDEILNEILAETTAQRL